MANFSSLKQAIQNYIKENGNKEITGNLLQEILLSMVVTMGDNAINGVLQSLSNEMISRENADGLLNQALTAEQQRAIAAETKSAVLDEETKTLVFKNDAGQPLYQVSVASLVSNGLVDVEVDGTNLVMTFHTESGDEEITIPIGDIFSPSNYYTKTQIDGLLSPITTAITNVSSRLNAGYIYLGLADPETIPTSATGKFFYIASQAGTYHFMSNGDIPIVISSDGLYILSGGVEADDWLLETIVTFTNNVQFNNSRLITSGGVFNAINPINELLHRNYMLAGVADTTTIPTDDTNVFYLAGQGGTYTHFLNGSEEPLVLPKGLTVIYRGIEDDGWNYWVVYTDNDFINTNRAQALTSNQQTEAQNNMMAKSYAPAHFSGLGKKMLAKNIQQVSGVSKNVMTQAFFQDEQGNALTNTVFVIQYDYDLNNATITVPAGCTLQFDGGSISNGTINADDLIIESDRKCFSNVKFADNFAKHGKVKAEWFISEYPQSTLDTVIDNTNEFRDAIGCGVKNIVIPTDKFIHLTETIVITKCINLITEDNTQGVAETAIVGIPRVDSSQPCIFSKNIVTIFDYQLTPNVVDGEKTYNPISIGKFRIVIFPASNTLTSATTTTPVVKIVPQETSGTLWGITSELSITINKISYPIPIEDRKDNYTTDNICNYTGYFISSKNNAISMVRILGYIYGAFYGVRCVTENGSWFTDLLFKFDSWCAYGAYVEGHNGYPHPVIIRGSHQADTIPTGFDIHDSYFVINSCEDVYLYGYVWDLNDESARSIWKSAANAIKRGLYWIEQLGLNNTIPCPRTIQDNLFNVKNYQNLLRDAIGRQYYLKNFSIKVHTGNNTPIEVFRNGSIIDEDLLFLSETVNRGAISNLLKIGEPHLTTEYQYMTMSYVIDRTIYVPDNLNKLLLWLCDANTSATAQKIYYDITISNSDSLNGTYTTAWTYTIDPLLLWNARRKVFMEFDITPYATGNFVKVEITRRCIDSERVAQIFNVYMPSFIYFDGVACYQTSERPTLGVQRKGAQIFNLTENKPNYWNGSAWVDATGV